MTRTKLALMAAALVAAGSCFGIWHAFIGKKSVPDTRPAAQAPIAQSPTPAAPEPREASEDELVKARPDLARREGAVLRLKLLDGSWKSYRNAEPSPEYLYSLVSVGEDPPSFLVRLGCNGCDSVNGALFIDRRKGEEATVCGTLPEFSPTRGAFLDYSMELGAEMEVCGTYLTVWSVKEAAPRQEFHAALEDWGPVDAKWKGPDEVVFGVCIPTEPGERPQCGGKGALRRVAGQWKVEAQKPAVKAPSSAGPAEPQE